jgi:hypothetical protein
MSIGLGVFMGAILVSAIALGAEVEDRVAPFVGSWRGTCDNFSGSFENATSNFAIERTVQPTADPYRFTWHTNFIMNGQRSERPYELIIQNPGSGSVAIDEGQGVLVAAQMMTKGTIWSVFEVQQTRLAMRDQVSEDKWDYEITTMSAQPTVTGFGVSSYQIISLQRCELDRISK